MSDSIPVLFSSPVHDDDDAPALGRTEVARRSIPATTAQDAAKARRLVCREQAGDILAAHVDVLPAGQADFARKLGCHHSQVGQMVRGDVAVQLGDLLAVPQVGALVLGSALEMIEGQPWPGEGNLVSEALLFASQALQVARQVEASPIEAMSDVILDGLIDLFDELGARIRRYARRLRDERARRAGVRP